MAPQDDCCCSLNGTRKKEVERNIREKEWEWETNKNEREKKARERDRKTREKARERERKVMERKARGKVVSGLGMSSSEIVADSFTGIDINIKLSAPWLNSSLSLHCFHPYLKLGSNAQHHDTAGANQTSRNPIPLDLNLGMAGLSHRGIVMPLPLPLPSLLGIGSLGKLLLRTCKHFTCEMLNHNDGFLVKEEILKSLAHCSLKTMFR
ncbi:hypothetical protein C8R48DRAFT_679647 [Suillus tomentosus]|nr:hypothetical protein C8R48DRAFT_679647 [Suillus tomentosus]